jgi:hypothetical protein
MVGGESALVFNSRRFLVDALLGIASLLLAVAAFTATADPYLLAVLAALIGIALKVEPRSRRSSVPSDSKQSIAEAETQSA